MAEPSTKYPIESAGSTAYWSVFGASEADESKVTSARAKAAGMSIPLTVGQWEVEYNCLVTSAGGNGDWRHALELADSLAVTDASFFMRVDTQNDTPGNENTGNSGNFDVSVLIQISAGKTNWIQIRCFLTVTAAGTLDFEWGQGSTNATATKLIKGSTVRAHKIN